MEDKSKEVKDLQENIITHDNTDISEDSYNEFEDNQEYTEEEIAEYEKRKAKLAKTMTIFIILIVLFFGLLVLLNKYFNG